MTHSDDNPVFARIREDISTHDVVLYMKGVPEFPQCGFSATVATIFARLGVKVKGIDVLRDPEIREGIKQFSDWPTVPQLYIKGEFIGGCDIVREMAESGELEALLKEKNILTA